MNDYLLNFAGVGLFACSTGMVAANAVNLSVEDKRCELVDGRLKKQSDTSVVGGGFGIAAAAFAFFMAVVVYMSNGVKNSKFYFTLLILAGVGLAVIGGIELAFGFDPEKRCPVMTEDGGYGFSGIEILSIFWCGLVMIGLFALLTQKYLK